jgi:hypothetical protein
MIHTGYVDPTIPYLYTACLKSEHFRISMHLNQL